ncbi:MAG: helix-turn-helix transcriptional regulator [Chitinophagaceae bacterium]|nr:helix-turn-helix transcriptional regulator [Chitinophagaceae bacterium]
MKPVPAMITPGNIFSIREFNQPLFSSEFHFHEECQLAYIIKGSGKRIIGDSIDHFDENELVFIGSNIPHLWYNTENKAAENKSLHSISLSLFISPKQLLEHLTAFGNIHKIEQLFEKAQRGMFISGKSKIRIISLLKKATHQHGIRHIITLLQIIDLLSNTEEYKLLASSTYTNLFQWRDNERMNNVYDYLIKHFKQDISLKEVAEIASMNPHAFCRFFKSRTQKTLTQFINEIRIGHACKLLNNKNQSITQIAYKCGFNNVSNFNRFFKIVKNQSPRTYRKELELG